MSKPTELLLTCPVCKGIGKFWRTFETEGESYPLATCNNCYHRYVARLPRVDHVLRTYDDRYFFGGGAGYKNYVADAELLRHQGVQYAMLAEPLRRGSNQRMLAIGVAAGFELLPFVDQGWRVLGIEPNRAMVEHATNEFGLTVHAGNFEDCVFEERFDLVLAKQVVAHFVDLSSVGPQLAAAVYPGGHLIVETWSYRSWSARLLGHLWHEYSPPSVWQWFSKQSLRRWLNQYGFVEEAIGRPQKFISGEHAASLLSYKLARLPGGRAFRWIPQLIEMKKSYRYPPEDLFWAIYRRDKD